MLIVSNYYNYLRHSCVLNFKGNAITVCYHYHLVVVLLLLLLLSLIYMLVLSLPICGLYMCVELTQLQIDRFQYWYGLNVQILNMCFGLCGAWRLSYIYVIPHMNERRNFHRSQSCNREHTWSYIAYVCVCVCVCLFGALLLVGWATLKCVHMMIESVTECLQCC